MEQEATGHDQKRTTNNVCGSINSGVSTRRTGESRARREGNSGCLQNNEHRLSGSFRESTAAWLREQGDWNGAKAISEDWVLLEGRAREMARAQAQIDLQQAHEQGNVNGYMQSLHHRGHVGLAKAGLIILETGGKLIGEQDRVNITSVR